MAIDTEAKRRSVSGYTNAPVNPPPSGTIGTGAREAITWLYAGIPAAPPVAPTLPMLPARFKYNKRTPDRKAYDGGWFDKELGNIQNSQLPFAIRTVTANTTATATDSVILCDATSGAITVALRDARQMQFAVMTIKKTDSSANLVSLAGAIDSIPTVILSSANTSLTIASNGVSWSLIGSSPGFAVGDVRIYGAGGRGLTDDTAALGRALLANAGGVVTIPRGCTCMISATLTLPSATEISGGGKLKAKASAAIAGAMINLSGAVASRVADLELDCNGDNTGCNYGVVTTGGQWNDVVNVYVHDTMQAGLEAIEETDVRFLDNRVVNCGRAPTDNHGIMLVSFSTGLDGALIQRNLVVNAMRKGITTFSSTPGFFKNLNISNNTVKDCGLGGIYLGRFSGVNLDTVTCNNNTVSGCPVNIQYGNITNGTCNGNAVSGSTNDCGIHAIDCTDCVIVGNSVDSSWLHGIQVGDFVSSLRVIVANNTVSRSNQSGSGSGAGIMLENATYCQVKDNTVSDDDGNQVFCVDEDVGSDFNLISNNILKDFTAVEVHITGANTIVDNPGYNPVGITAITVGASPFTYTAGHSPETVSVIGGTVSGITKSGTAIAMTTNQQIPLAPGQAIVVTYSVAPTMVTDSQ